MPFIEQILYGQHHLRPTSGKGELARSAGVGEDVAREVCALCDAWGEAPALGLAVPVILSHPLKSVMPSLRGQLYAVIQVAVADSPFFHIVVMNEAIFRRFGRNPVAVNRAVSFCREWDGREDIDRVEVEPEDHVSVPDPPPGEWDVGIVDEAVLQFMQVGKLELPLAEPTTESNRVLGLVVACLPTEMRRDLHFSSFATSSAHSYGVACVATENVELADWRRLMLTRVDAGASPEQLDYKARITDLLGQNDVAGIDRASHQFTTMLVQDTPASVSAATGRSLPAPHRSAPAARAVAIVPAVAVKSALAPPEIARCEPVAEALAPRVRPSRSQPAGKAYRRRSGGAGRTLGVVAVLGVIAAASWWGVPKWQAHYRPPPAEELLSARNVGLVYERALQGLGSRGLGLKAAGDKGQQRAIGRLRHEALEPLVRRVGLFVDLSAAGIQPNPQPVREVDRLAALATQGRVLEDEMARLELAWFSLVTGTNWRDVGRISDAGVAARWDSLETTDRGTRRDMKTSMGTTELGGRLASASVQMRAMATLLALLNADHWSPAWGLELAAAADRVLPTAGTANRAFRNSAFLLARLKRAEHQSVDVPGNGSWPSTTVRSIVARLRREVGQFPDQCAPVLVSDTVAFYTALRPLDGDYPAPSGLADNVAVRFDPELYRVYLQAMIQ